MKTEHTHAQILRWIADGETIQSKTVGGIWFDLHPAEVLTWIVRDASGDNFRLKPNTIRIGEYDVPEPIREAPAIGSYYFITDISNDDGYSAIKWQGDEADRRYLERNIVHLTAEAAKLHSKALLSFY